MIFTAQHARAVLDNRKTQTRRLVKAGKRCRYSEGHDYAVQPGRGKPAIGRIKILDVREEHVGDITYKDARAEGHRTTDAFKAAWVRIHDANWIERQEVTTDEHGTIDGDRWMTDTDLLPRFDARHAHKLVHVITFTAVQDNPLFLATQHDILHGRTDTGEYTTRRDRAIDDLEVIPPTNGEVERARLEGERQRESFKRDLEAERARRRHEERNARLALFRDAA